MRRGGHTAIHVVRKGYQRVFSRTNRAECTSKSGFRGPNTAAEARDRTSSELQVRRAAPWQGHWFSDRSERAVPCGAPWEAHSGVRKRCSHVPIALNAPANRGLRGPTTAGCLLGGPPHTTLFNSGWLGSPCRCTAAAHAPRPISCVWTRRNVAPHPPPHHGPRSPARREKLGKLLEGVVFFPPGTQNRSKRGVPCL